MRVFRGLWAGVVAAGLVAAVVASCTPATGTLDGVQHVSVVSTGRRAWSVSSVVPAPGYRVGLADDGTVAELRGEFDFEGADGASMRLKLDLSAAGSKLWGPVTFRNVTTGKELVGLVDVARPTPVRDGSSAKIAFTGNGSNTYDWQVSPATIRVELTVDVDSPPVSNPVVGETFLVPALQPGPAREWPFEAPAGTVSLHVAGVDGACPSVMVLDGSGGVLTALSGCGTVEFDAGSGGSLILSASAEGPIAAGSRFTLSTPVTVGNLGLSDSTGAPALLPGQRAVWQTELAGDERFSAAAWSQTGSPTSVQILDPTGGLVAVSSPETAGRAATLDVGMGGAFSVVVTNEDDEPAPAGHVRVRAGVALEQGALGAPPVDAPELQPGEVARWTTERAGAEPHRVTAEGDASACVALVVSVMESLAQRVRSGCGNVAVDAPSEAGALDVRVINTGTEPLSAAAIRLAASATPVLAAIGVNEPAQEIQVGAGAEVVVPLLATPGERVRVGATGDCLTVELWAGGAPTVRSSGCDDPLTAGTEDDPNSRAVAVEAAIADGTAEIHVLGDPDKESTVQLEARSFADLPPVPASTDAHLLGEIPAGSRALVGFGDGDEWAATGITVSVQDGAPCVRIDQLRADNTINDLGTACPDAGLDTIVLTQGPSTLRLWSDQPVPAETLTVTTTTITGDAADPVDDESTGTAQDHAEEPTVRTAASLSGPNQSAADQPCKPYLVIGLRGSGEATGFGTRVWPVVTELQRHLGGDNIAMIAIERPDYPSADVPFPDAATAAAVAAGGVARSVAIARYLNRWGPYLQSLADGSDALYDILQQRAHCNETIILAGYSQGAMAVHRTMLDLQANGQYHIVNRISGAVLIADGDRHRHDTMNTYGTAGRLTHGVTHTFHMGNARGTRFNSSLGAGVRSVCNARDIVCDHVIPASWITGFGTHTGNGYKNSQIVRDAARHAAVRARVQRYNASGWPAPSPLKAIAVAAGSSHSCALTTSGGVKCWGGNGSGQLGDGTTTGRATPVDVAGLGSGVKAVVPSNAFTCALTNSGAVRCWGSNTWGQLGDGTTTDRSTPVEVVGLNSGVIGLTAGHHHSCALTSGGGVKCWGGNIAGARGDGTLEHRYTPVDVVGLSSGVKALAAGGIHTCALTSAGGVKCWGSNQYGELGDGTTTQRHTPVDAVGLGSGVQAVDAGAEHTCALIANGGLKCWGHNVGQLGDGTTTDRYTPVDVVDFGSGAQAVTAGNAHTCALTSGGAVKCWGYNGYAQLGDGTTTDRYRPVDVVGLESGIQSLTAGGYHSCALTNGGGVKCWGENTTGQLGDGTIGFRFTPVDVLA